MLHQRCVAYTKLMHPHSPRPHSLRPHSPAGALEEARTLFLAGRSGDSLSLLVGLGSSAKVWTSVWQRPARSERRRLSCNTSAQVAHNVAVARFVKEGREDAQALEALFVELKRVQARRLSVFRQSQQRVARRTCGYQRSRNGTHAPETSLTVVSMQIPSRAL